MERKLTQERRGEIAQCLMHEGKVSATALARQYAVSTETIRKDLLWLEEQGLAQRGYGGAVASSRALERSFGEKATDNRQKKRRIALATVAQIPPGATVLLDSGSTVLEVARLLSTRSDLSFFTNSLQAARLLAEKRREVFIPGGKVRTSSQAITGASAAEMLSRVNAQVAILGASGLDQGQGPCVESVEEAEMKMAMIRAAQSAYLVADASKYAQRARIRFAQWSDFSLLITDDGLRGDALEQMRGQINVLVAQIKEEANP